MQCTSEAEVKL